MTYCTKTDISHISTRETGKPDAICQARAAVDHATALPRERASWLRPWSHAECRLITGCSTRSETKPSQTTSSSRLVQHADQSRYPPRITRDLIDGVPQLQHNPPCVACHHSQQGVATYRHNLSRDLGKHPTRVTIATEVQPRALQARTTLRVVRANAAREREVLATAALLPPPPKDPNWVDSWLHTRPHFGDGTPRQDNRQQHPGIRPSNIGPKK
jgi:hypothetical protein